MPSPDPIPPTTPKVPGDHPLRQLLERGQGRLRAFVADLCRGGSGRSSTPCDPEDVAQEAMVRAWRYRGSLDPEQDGISWLLRIAFRVYLDQSAPRPRPAPIADLPEPHCPAPDAARETDGRDAVAALVAGLRPVERNLLLGFHRDGLSLQDLAAQHGLPLNTVKSHLHRARRRLRERNRPT